ncbi:MAG TPA: hypothetical protein VHU80_15525 [Polyangiaceae bacterium]|jgi:hypothetical protein|nr:hypothetical protein [Polyangiaceae bacterium]
MMKLVPMGLGDILDAAFRLCRKRFSTYIGIAAVVAVPSSLGAAVLVGLGRRFATLQQPEDDGLLNVVMALSGHGGRWASAAAASNGTAQLLNVPALGGSVLAMLAYAALLGGAYLTIMSFAYPLCAGALIVNISSSYLGETLGAGQSYARAFRKLWRLLMAQAWTTLLVLLGALLCVIPGLILALQLAVVPQVVLLEDVKAWAAIGRSRALMADYLGKAFLLWFVVSLLGFVIGTAISTAIEVIPWPLPLVGDFLSFFFLQIVMMPLSIATTVLFYYDLRIRKEAFDLQHLASSMVEFRAP